MPPAATWPAANANCGCPDGDTGCAAAAADPGPRQRAPLPAPVGCPDGVAQRTAATGAVRLRGTAGRLRELQRRGAEQPHPHARAGQPRRARPVPGQPRRRRRQGSVRRPRPRSRGRARRADPAAAEGIQRPRVASALAGALPPRDRTGRRRSTGRRRDLDAAAGLRAGAPPDLADRRLQARTTRSGRRRGRAAAGRTAK